jgi:hypothetical protein
MRRGRKVADMVSSGTNMEDVVAYITGAREPMLARTSEAGA